MDARQTAATDQARAFLADLEDALAPAVPTAHRDDTLPTQTTIGTTPPVPQPGRPPMSQRATDASALMLSAGVASVPIGGMTALVVYALGQVDPTTLAIAAAAPAGLAVPILALCRFAGRARQVVEAAPPVHHHHYAGPVDQRTVTSTARGLVARSRGEMKG
ncbi:hypothetical protein ACF09I_35610 [Streptomyces sp. NPDC014940]|uniref:hypothetical protein n=1 Tax=Streptomyces sp. NPDC014940 TaxID=3364932 RepID=UPI0037027BE5